MRSNSVFFIRQRQIHDRQRHENEGLQRDDQDMERGPRATGHELDPPGQQRDQDEDHFRRIQVAEQTQRKRNGLGDQLDHVQQQVRRPQDRVLAERVEQQFLRIATPALALDRVDQDQREHDDRQAERAIDVGRGHDAGVLEAEQLVGQQRQIVDRNDVHEIPQEDPDEDRQRQRRDELTRPVETVLDRVVDEIDKHLDEILELARHAGRGAARGQNEEEQEEEPERDRDDQGVGVDRPQALAVAQVRDVMLDVFAR